MDLLNELLVSSESLTTQIGETGGVVKNLRRGVRNRTLQHQHHWKSARAATLMILYSKRKGG